MTNKLTEKQRGQAVLTGFSPESLEELARGNEAAVSAYRSIAEAINGAFTVDLELSARVSDALDRAEDTLLEEGVTKGEIFILRDMAKRLIDFNKVDKLSRALKGLGSGFTESGRFHSFALGGPDQGPSEVHYKLTIEAPGGCPECGYLHGAETPTQVIESPKLIEGELVEEEPTK